MDETPAITLPNVLTICGRGKKFEYSPKIKYPNRRRKMKQRFGWHKCQISKNQNLVDTMNRNKQLINIKFLSKRSH